MTVGANCTAAMHVANGASGALLQVVIEGSSCELLTGVKEEISRAALPSFSTICGMAVATRPTRIGGKSSVATPAAMRRTRL